MKKLFIKSLIFAIVIVSILFVWQNIIDKGLRQSKNYGTLYSDWDSLYASKIKADLVVMGSSRAAIQINPQILKDSLKMTSVNLGMDGHKFLSQYYKYFLYEKYNGKPKAIILTLDILSLIHAKEFFNYEQFIPYLGDSIIQEIVAPHGLFTWKDYYLPMVKFSHRKDMIFEGTLSYIKPLNIDNGRARGFGSVDKEWDTTFVNNAIKKMYIDGYTAKLDSKTQELFVDFIEYCNTNNIKLFLVYPPEYLKYNYLCKNRTEVKDYYSSIAQKYNIPYFDYANSDISSNNKLFFDSQHLNTEGVNQFNEYLISDIKMFFF